MSFFRLLLLGLSASALLSAALLWTPDRSRDELESQYLRAEEDMVTVLDTRLHVRDSGLSNGPAVLLLHGLGASLHTWEPWAEALEKTHRVIRFDMPGAGLSPADARNDYSDQRLIALINALLDDRDVAQIDLVGHSMGGRIAWRFAAANPERVRRLVLIAPDGFASPGFEYETAPEVPAIMESMRYFLPKFALRANVEASYGDPARLQQSVMDRYYDLILAPGNRAALLERTRQTWLLPPKPILTTIDTPTLLVWGERDIMIPVSNAEDYLHYLPNAQLASFTDLGHVPHEEAPLRTLPVVVEFLEQP